MIKINNIDVKPGIFPNGESYIDFPNDVLTAARTTGSFIVDFKFGGNQDIWDLMQLVDKMKQYKYPRYLNMFYVPYSRMDRSELYRLFSLKTFANLINGMEFSSVTIMEPHSDVTPALFDRVRVIDMSMQLAYKLLKDDFGILYTGDNLEEVNQQMAEKKVCFVWPDGGADKRYSKQFKGCHTMTCIKERDFQTGWLTVKYLVGADSHQDCEHVIIVDDLCSRGGTFVGAAGKLRELLPNLKTIALCVTHCENTIADGDILKTDLIDKVYTTNSILDIDVVSHKKLYVKGV